MTMKNIFGNNYVNVIIRKIIPLLSVVLISSCSASVSSGLTEPDTSQPIPQSASEISLSTSTPEEKPTFSNVAQNLNAVDFSSEQNALKNYINFARSEINRAFLNGDECMITLWNVFGNENPEMIVAIKKKQPSVNHEYYFSTDENDEPIYLGEFYRVHDAFYTDGEFVCAVWEDETEMVIDKLQYPIEDTVSPDLAEYQNHDALDFINNTHMYFLRYDNEDWDSEKQSWKNPNETAALFYYEDSGLYEAYSVSKRVLELTSIEINDYINRDGNHVYSYLPGENYLVSRREYEQIKSKIFEILTEVTDEPDISSGWINIDDVDNWLDSLA